MKKIKREISKLIDTVSKVAIPVQSTVFKMSNDECTDLKEKTEELPTIFIPQIAELIQKKKNSNSFMGLDMVFAESQS